MKTTSPTRGRVGRARLAVEARAVLEQHVAAGGVHHRISLCTALNSRRAGALEQLEQGRLDGGDDRAGALHALQAALVVERVARADRVGGHVHLDAAREQVVDRLADAHVRLDPAHERLAGGRPMVEALGAHGREDGLLDARLVLQADLGGGVPEALRVLLADDRGQPEDARGVHELRARARPPGEGGVGPEALLDVHHDQRGAVAREQAHPAPISASARSRWASAPAQIVSSTRPRRRRPAKQQFSERLSQPCSPAIHSASRSSSARLAGSPGSDQRRRAARTAQRRRSSARRAARARSRRGSTSSV